MNPQKSFRTILFFSLILISTSSYSQSESKFDFGISTGVLQSYSIFESDLASRTNSSLSYNFALDLYFDISDLIQIRTGVSIEQYDYETFDFSLNFASDLINGSVDINKSFSTSLVDFSYLIIPIEIKYKLTGEANHLYAIGGLRPKFLVRNNSTHTFFLCGDNTSTGTAEFNNFILDLSIGFGYEFKVGSTKLFVSLSSFLGVNQINDLSMNITENSRLAGIGLFTGIRF